MKLPSLEASGWQRKETRSPSFTQNSALSVDIFFFFQCLGTDFVMQAELLLMFFYFIALLVKLKHSMLCWSTSL